MIRHTVLFQLKSDVSKLEVENAFTQVLDCLSVLPGILAITGGTCYFHENQPRPGFTHGFSIDFQNKTARDAFVHHAAANPIKEHIVKIAQGGYEGIWGFDFGAC